jgi:hypothetical protein
MHKRTGGLIGHWVYERDCGWPVIYHPDNRAWSRPIVSCEQDRHQRSAAPLARVPPGRLNLTAPEAVAYGLVGEVADDPVGAPESGTPA